MLRAAYEKPELYTDGARVLLYCRHKMKKIHPLLLLFCAAILMTIMHVAGTFLYLYWRVEGFDRVVHFTGGFLAAFTTLYFLYWRQVAEPKNRHLIIIGILAALIIGVLWEIFELEDGMTFLADSGYWVDTVGDVVSDIVGGLVACLYFVYGSK